MSFFTSIFTATYRYYQHFLSAISPASGALIIKMDFQNPKQALLMDFRNPKTPIIVDFPDTEVV